MIALYGDGGHAVSIGGAVDVSLRVSDATYNSSNAGRYEWCVAIGDNQTRSRIAKKLALEGERFTSIVAPSAVVLSSVPEGTCVLHRAVIEPGCEIGKHSIINSGAVVCHNSKIGDYTHISPGATICGGVTIGDGVWVGAGSTVKEKVRIGDGSVIGAGSVVVSDIGENVMAYGVPCRIIRELEKVHYGTGDAR